MSRLIGIIVACAVAVAVAGCGKVTGKKPIDASPLADTPGGGSSACVLDRSHLDSCTL